MNKIKQHKKLVPELRFSEFVDDGEWEQYMLGTIADFSKGKSISKKNIVNNGKLFCVRYGELYTDYNEVIDKVISSTNLPEDELIISKGNEVIIPSSGETQIDIARASCVLRAGIALGGDLNIIRSKLNGVFLSYYLNGPKKKAIAQMAQGVSVMHLYNSQLENLEIEVPTPQEQQKIANCLSSLDNLIGAETEKLSTLKTHKKGLLQQLFPANGETVPQLRFPEFVGDGEWEETTLEECLDYSQPTPYLVNSTDYNDEFETPVLTAGKTFILGYTDEKNGIFTEKLPVIIFDDFTTATKFVDFPFKAKSSAMKILIAKNDANIKFVFESMQNMKYEVGVHKRHWISIFSKLKILVPKNPKEQQKIAKTLTSVDELIAAQTEKIETLKEHKKGLMQGLFPNTTIL